MLSKLNLDQAVLLVAGTTVVVSVLLAWYVHPAWLWLALLMGLHLMQMAFTGICPLARILSQLGVRSGNALT